MEKKLYKSQKDKMLCGVCSGIAKYFGVDPTLVRLGFVALLPLSGSSLLVYLVGLFVMPDDPIDENKA